LNRRLAEGVYAGVIPLVRTARGFGISEPGEVVDWLVVMRRFDGSETREHALATHNLTGWQLDRLVTTLVAYYRRARAILVSPDAHPVHLARSLSDNKCLLLHPRLGMRAPIKNKRRQSLSAALSIGPACRLCTT
jgi:aminoglycoside phosphotransferase family enzyme